MATWTVGKIVTAPFTFVPFTISECVPLENFVVSREASKPVSGGASGNTEVTSGREIPRVAEATWLPSKSTIMLATGDKLHAQPLTLAFPLKVSPFVGKSRAPHGGSGLDSDC